jgi:hypothetical protein
MNNSINNIHCRASGKNIHDLAKELDTAGVPYQRGPICFSAGSTEFLNILLPVASASIGAISAILAAYLKRDKKLRIVFEDGKIQELDSSNYKPDELLEAVKKIKEIDFQN